MGEIPLGDGISEDGDIEIYVSDLLAASDASGQQRPTGSTDFGEVGEWLNVISGYGESVVVVPIPSDMHNSAANAFEYKQEIGFSLTDVDAAIEVGPAPISFTILAGALSTPATLRSPTESSASVRVKTSQ